MSAEILRRAAGLMRERAEAASEGINWWGVEPMTRALDATFSPPSAEQDAEHIASWHPAVALAVADWLVAESHQPETEHEGGAYTTGGPSLMAIHVALTYLGGAR